MIKINYVTEEERELALTNNADNRLVMDCRHSDGNYLLFDATPWDLSSRELIEILKLILNQINELRSAAGMAEITYDKARDAIKAAING